MIPDITYFEGEQLDGLTRIRQAVKTLPRVRVFDMSEMGTGKTPVQIQLIVDAAREPGYKGTLVTAPKNTLFAWAQQLDEFAPELSWVIVDPSTSDKLPALGDNIYSEPLVSALINGAKRYDVYLMYYDTPTLAFERLVDKEAGKKASRADKLEVALRFADEILMRVDRIVFDEATSFANESSSRSEMLIHAHPLTNTKTKGSVWATHILPKMRYIAMLTGTPVRRNLMNIWSMVRILDSGESLGVTPTAFRREYQIKQIKRIGKSSEQRIVHNYVDREDAFEKVIARIQRSIVLIRNVNHDLPELERVDVAYTMSPAVAEAYNDMLNRMVVELSSGELVSAANKAVMVNKLCQISSGAVFTSAEDYTLIDNRRNELVAKLVTQVYGRKCVVFYQWRHQALALKETMEKHGLKVVSTFRASGSPASSNERAQAIKSFQDGDAEVYLSHPLSSGHGITLTAANAVIWASPTPDLELYLQGSKRVHRRGQTKKTYVVHVVAKNAGRGEGRMVELLTQKHLSQEAFFDALWGALTRGEEV